MNGSPSGVPVIGTSRWLLQAAQRGDRSAQHELVRRYEPLVRRVVGRLRLPADCEREDLAQEARIGLWAAIRAWQPERGPFPAFADRCVRNQALLALQAACARKHRVLTYAAPLTEQHGGSVKYEELTHRDLPPLTNPHILSAPRDARSDPELRLLVQTELAELRRALPTLSARQRVALIGTVNGLTYRQLAPAIGGSPKAAKHVVLRARRRLATAMADAA